MCRKFFLILIFSLVPILSSFGQDRKSVLFLVSYDAAFPTFKIQYNGILNGFEKGEIDVELHIEFLDSKRFPYTEVKAKAHDSLKYKINQNGAFDYVISADDNALHFIDDYYEDLFRDTPVVFFGVNDLKFANEQELRPGFTGFVEEVSYKETLDAIKKILPNAQELYLLYDATSSGTGDYRRIREINAGSNDFQFHYLSLANLSFSELYEKISQFDIDQPILLLSAFKDRKGETLTFYESVRKLSEYSGAPIFHLWGHGIGDGLLGGKVVDHGYYGELSAGVVCDLINGKEIDDIDTEVLGNNRFLFDSNVMDSFEISRKSLPEDAVVINMKRIFSRESLIVLFGLVLVIFALLSVIFFIYHLYQKKAKAEKKVQQLNTTLENEREQLSITLKSIGDGVIVTDANCRITFINKVTEQLTGWSNDEVEGKEVEEVFRIFNEETDEKRENIAEEVIRYDRIFELANHTYLLGKDQNKYLIEDSAAPIKDHDGNIIGVIIVFRDMTEKAKLRESSNQNQKLESLGVLAGGIAHDFNNLLGGIFGFCELAKIQIKNGNQEKTEDFLSKVLEVTNKAKSLTNQLLTFSKGGQPHKKLVSLKETVEQTVTFALSGSNVKHEIVVDENIKNCNCDVNQISQCIDNIVINAVQSMPNGGEIKVECHNADNCPDELPGNSYIEICISDTGPGIDPKIVKKIFDPFFTTKEKGHGLGLATVHSIMNNHDGLVKMESSLDKGTVFHLYLPASSDPYVHIEEKKSRERSNNELILVIDDQDYILELMNEMLTALGYKVQTAKSSHEALTYIHKDSNNPKGTEIRACIIDQTLPGDLRGDQIANEIRKISSDLPLIASSGYTDSAVMSHPREYNYYDSISKPIDFTDLSKKLRTCIGSSVGLS